MYDVALYVLLMARGPNSASVNYVDPVTYEGFNWIIENDDDASACIEYLIEAGTPVFKDIVLHDTYVNLMCEELRHGSSPATAQNRVLQELSLNVADLLHTARQSS